MVTFLGGILSDFVPSTFLFPLGLILCGSTTFLFPLGSSVTYFASIWFLNGIGHGLALPAAMRLTKQFSTGTTFATNWSFVMTAVNIAGVLNPMASAFLANAFSWQTAVYISGVITLATGLVVLILFQQFNSKSENANSQAKKQTGKSKSPLRVTDLFVFPVLWILISNR